MTDRPSLYLVDSTSVYFRELANTITVPGVIDARAGDILIVYVPKPGDRFPAIMRVPDVTLKELRDTLGNWDNRLPDELFSSVAVHDSMPYMQTPFTREELGLK